MQDISENEEQKEALFSAYRSFEEFNGLTEKQLLEIDQFLRSYSELVYNCFSRMEHKAKVIHLAFDQVNQKAA